MIDVDQLDSLFAVVIVFLTLRRGVVRSFIVPFPSVGVGLSSVIVVPDSIADEFVEKLPQISVTDKSFYFVFKVDAVFCIVSLLVMKFTKPLVVFLDMMGLLGFRPSEVFVVSYFLENFVYRFSKGMMIVVK